MSSAESVAAPRFSETQGVEMTNFLVNNRRFYSKLTNHSRQEMKSVGGSEAKRGDSVFCNYRHISDIKQC